MKQAALPSPGVAAGFAGPAAGDHAAPEADADGTRVATPDTVVETTAGKLRGFTRNGVLSRYSACGPSENLTP
jgi:hypothetical protein